MKRLVIAIVLLGALSACSKAAQEGVVIDSNGHHAAGWATMTGGGHPAAYLANPDLCTQCHGNPLDPAGNGGISGVSCFSASFGGLTCHPQGPGGHPQGFASPDLHGARVKANASGVNGMAFCKNCHGPAYRGAGAAADCIGCHQLAHPGTNAPHSPAPWRGGLRTHTNVDQSNAAACAQCHTAGANLTASLRLPSYQSGTPGCFNATLCHGQVGHSDTSTFPSPTLPWASPANHGLRARYQPNQNNGLNFCQTCHGSNFAGGTALQTCLSTSGCHGVAAPHPAKADWTLAAGALSHVNVDQVDPALSDVGTSNAPVCSGCHNATTSNLSAPYLARFASSPAGSFKAGTPGCFNATMCHGDVKNDCSVCHGSSSVSNTVPFHSLAGATAPSDAKVGAHVKHLKASTQSTPFVTALSVDVSCSQCHPVPGSPAISGSHRNGAVQFSFGSLATANGTLTPSVTRNGSGVVVCANTYCHGATIPGGSNTAPAWNDTGYLTGSGCGTCHGFPPAVAAHASVTSATACAGCHPHVNATNNGFSDPTKHINGVIDASGGAAPHAVPNFRHQAAGTGAACTGCHAIGTATSVYPAAVLGNPPDCRGCHKKAAPGIGCGSCHGGTDGRPTGTSFPDIARRHSNPNNHQVACSFCHGTAGTNQDAHGPSNHQNHNDANVIINMNSDAAGITFTRNGSGGGTCTGTCHGQTHSSYSW